MVRGLDAGSVEVPENGFADPTASWWANQGGQRPAVEVSVGTLLSSDSPRLAGENMDHARTLAESERVFPPIIVNRSTMRVIDGVHRLRAAAIRGQGEIHVHFFDGHENDAFVLAVEVNVAHGMPLSRADRKAAAARIISSHSQWSDRVIASKAGLDAKTVAAIRRCSTDENSRLNGRIGRDGRVRPLNATLGRRIAAAVIRGNPDIPLRKVASAAGISLGTAQDVRKRLGRDENPVPSMQLHHRARKKIDQSMTGKSIDAIERSPQSMPASDRAAILKKLSRDPSVRFADAGRILLRVLQVLSIDANGWKRLVDGIPPHCIPAISEAARACADSWQEFAEHLERR